MPCDEDACSPALLADPQRSALTSAAAPRTCLVVFARAPRVGAVKTRLVQPPRLSAEVVCALYRAFLRDCCAVGQGSGVPLRRLYVAPPRGDDEAEAALQALAAEHGFALRSQEGGDLGARMARALQTELAGAEQVLLIGSDTPHLSAAHLQAAARLLIEGAEVVLGPALDGGYWLVGAARRFGGVDALFAPGIAWGGEQVLRESLARLAAVQARVALLPQLFDVDTPADLERLVDLLRREPLGEDGAPRAVHTAAALRGLLGG